MASSQLLSHLSDSPNFDNHFDCRLAMEKLLCLENTQPDISHATHQCALFASNPKIEHGKAVKWLGTHQVAKIAKSSFRCKNPQMKEQVADGSHSQEVGDCVVLVACFCLIGGGSGQL